MQMLSIIPMKVSFKVPHSVLPVKEATGISLSRLRGTERCLYKRIIVGGSWPCKELRHPVKLKDGFYRSSFHLLPSVIDNFRSLLFRTIQDVLGEQPTFEKLPGIFCPLAPTDQPVDRFAGVLVKEQAQIQKRGSLIGTQEAYVPAPPLVGTRDLSSCGRN
jgi:hypothetical protein